MFNFILFDLLPLCDLLRREKIDAMSRQEFKEASGVFNDWNPREKMIKNKTDDGGIDGALNSVVCVAEEVVKDPEGLGADSDEDALLTKASYENVCVIWLYVNCGNVINYSLWCIVGQYGDAG